MASSSMASTLSSSSSSISLRRQIHSASSLSPISFISPNFRVFPRNSQALLQHRTGSGPSIRAQTLEFSDTFFEDGFEEEGGFGGEDDPPNLFGSAFTTVEDREEPQCPPGLRQYETMTVLRPDMSEDERLTLTQKYEELLVAGGGMYVEVFNRGVIPLAYEIKKKNKAGETNTYLDGIYLLFTYFTKPESINVLGDTLKRDDNVIRSSTFKIRRRKY